MTIELQASVDPLVWPAGEMKDVLVRLTLKNNSSKPVKIYPQFTALAWKKSVANLGMSWDFDFVSPVPGASASGHELRTYYGPPGEPVSPEAIKKAGVVLKPGASKQATYNACWIPRALLDPASLSLAVLDPEGYDNLKAIPNLSKSSVLVFGVNSGVMRTAVKQKDFLRGYMVALFNGSGKFVLKAKYRQEPFMYPVIEKLEAVALPVEIRVGEK